MMGEANLIQLLRDLQNRNESLSNDVTMKEIVINCIEYKMFEISKHVVKATEFNKWIDRVLREKMIAADDDVMMQNEEAIYATRQDMKNNNWEKLRGVLLKYIDNVELKEECLVAQLEKWLDERKHREIKLEIENREYRCMLSNIEDTISKFGDVCMILKKHMKEGNKKDGGNGLSCVQHVDEWLTQKKNTELKLRRENEEYRQMVINIESGITHLDSKIENFTECINNADISLLNNAQPFHDDSFKNMLEYIQNLIRHFEGGECNDFEIRDFPLWLEKLQCRIDNLQNDLQKEQKSRVNEEKQYTMEREILNYLFNQKQKEIMLLKEKVYDSKATHADAMMMSNVMQMEKMGSTKESIPVGTML